jgi:hypothetical protein
MDHYNIYREGSVAGNFELIDTVSGLNYSIFNDVVASPKVHSWRYKISAVNQCGEEGPLSEVHKTIHIVIAQSLGNTYNVSWDEYEGFSYSTVYLWRYTNVTGWSIVDSLPSNVYSYTDNVPNPLGLDYMIEIKPPSNCSVGKAQDYNSSRSNKCSGHMLPGVGTGASNNGIEEYATELPISMYPNPSKGTVNFNNENNEITQVSLVNAMGQTVEQFNFISSENKDFSYLEAGIYFVKFTVNNQSSIKKLILN